jgi:hypothetical protein
LTVTLAGGTAVSETVPARPAATGFAEVGGTAVLGLTVGADVGEAEGAELGTSAGNVEALGAEAVVVGASTTNPDRLG